MQALEYGQKLAAEQFHFQEMGIATLSALFVNANRDPKKGQPAKPADFFYFQSIRDAGVQIPAQACDAFFSLIADSKLPGWVLDIAPVEQLRKCKGNGRFSKPRAWLGDGLLLIQPRIEGELVTAAIAFMFSPTPVLELQDVDSGTPFMVQIETPQISWSLDAELALYSHV